MRPPRIELGRRLTERQFTYHITCPIYQRYRQAAGKRRRPRWKKFCQVSSYNRRYAISLLNCPLPLCLDAKPVMIDRARGFSGCLC